MFSSGLGLRRLATAAMLQQCMLSLRDTMPTYLVSAADPSHAFMSLSSIIMCQFLTKCVDRSVCSAAAARRSPT